MLDGLVYGIDSAMLKANCLESTPAMQNLIEMTGQYVSEMRTIIEYLRPVADPPKYLEL
jgi:hypothetical protein